MKTLLPILLMTFAAHSALAVAKADLVCELTILPENQDTKQTTTFSVSLGRPEQGEFQGYAYYITYMKTTKRAASFQISPDVGFFVHGSSDQPETHASFTGLSFDPILKNSVYLGCASAFLQN
jgi:hypothetical protein